MRRLVPFLIVLGALGCELPLGLSGGAVDASLTPTGVRVTNNLNEVAHYLVIDPRSLMLWAPCTRADCPALGPNESVLVPYDRIPGHSGGSGTINVHWWEHDAGEEGVAPISKVRTITLVR